MLFGIQPTYEELKPGSEGYRRAVPIGIQPTYEELKHMTGSLGALFQACIQPTYEELKLKPEYITIHDTGKYPAYL